MTTKKITKSKITKPDPAVGTMALWIMTPFGILMPAIRPPKTVEPGDSRMIQVRARRREYLDALRERYMQGELGPPIHTPKMDYQWRAYCTPEALAAVMSRMVLEIDSQRFKPTTEGPCGLSDHKLAAELHSLYTSLWSTQLQHGDGTSSYDKAWTGGKLSKPDPLAPAGICQREGHWWPGVSKGKTVLCRDCDSRKRLADGTVIYPKARAAPQA